MLGQQSLYPFLNLRVDIDAVLRDNKLKVGIRKLGFLIHQGAVLTKDEKLQMQKENIQKYGLCREYVKMIKLPSPSNIQIYDMENIVNGRKKFTIPEKIEHILALKESLTDRLGKVREGQIIINW